MTKNNGLHSDRLPRLTKLVLRTYNHIVTTDILEDRMEYPITELRDTYGLSEDEAVTLFYMINVQRSGDNPIWDA